MRNIQYQKPLILLFSILCFLNFSACQNERIPHQSTNDYPVDISITPIANLPNEIKESSGLVFFDNTIWTHNDSGDDPVLFQLNMENAGEEMLLFSKKILIENAENQDWEEIAHDENFIYVGDFGNNGGHRQNLVIYKIVKSELEKDTISQFERIEFKYPDQDNFEYRAYKHNFDCEAMIVLKDSIYLFSKNHQDYQTRLYSLPKNAGNHTAQLLDFFDTKGTITAAGINNEKGVLALTGYKYNSDNSTYNPFLWVFWDYSSSNFMGGKSQRVNFPIDRQIEGICSFDNENFLISCESESGNLGELFLFNPLQWMN